METLGKPREEEELIEFQRLDLNPDKPIIGHDFKVSDEFLKNLNKPYKTFILELTEHFKRNMLYTVIGYDTKYLDVRNTEGAHYHVRFISYNPQKTIEHSKAKFVTAQGAKGIKGFTHTTCKNGTLYSINDIYQYLGYALKEKTVYIPDALNVPEFIAHTKQALLIKSKSNEKDLAELKKKKETKTKEQIILEYIHANYSEYQQLNTITIPSILIVMVRYQREKQEYIENFRMLRIAHLYLQKHTQLDDETITQLRFGRLYN